MDTETIRGTDGKAGEGAPAERTSEPVGFACDLTAMTADERKEHLRTAAYLFGEAVQESEELSQGYAFRFAAGDYPVVAAFVTNERLCCPFLTFTVEVTAQQGPVWLRLTGPAGVKDFLLAELQPRGI